MLEIIENESLRLSVAVKGAEMQSLVRKADGREYLWPGRESLWPDRAPWLFPLIGQLKNGCYTHRGKTYCLPMHGFAKAAPFSVERVSGSQLTLTLRDTAETLQCYPWRFELTIHYELVKQSVQISLCVRCQDDEEMLFSLGAHPGFLCAPGDRLLFRQSTALRCHRLNAEHLLELSDATEVAPAITLSEALFERDAMIFSAPDARCVRLERQNGASISLEYGRVPFMGLWSKAGGRLPFVCLEPWYGVDDPATADGALSHKLGIQRLPAGQRFTMELKLTVE